MTVVVVISKSFLHRTRKIIHPKLIQILLLNILCSVSWYKSTSITNILRLPLINAQSSSSLSIRTTTVKATQQQQQQQPTNKYYSNEIVTIPRTPIISPYMIQRIVSTNPNVICPHDRITRTQQRRLARWHDSSTWPNNIIPNIAYENITLPTNKRILIDQSIIPILGIITIPSTSTLIIGITPSNRNSTTSTTTTSTTTTAIVSSASKLRTGKLIDIKVTGIIVHGSLLIGSERCLITYQTPIFITLVGKRPIIESQVKTIPTSYKGIVVSNGGRISIHGMRYTPTWTRLALSAIVGNKYIIIQGDYKTFNWVIGQIIILITSSYKDSRDYNRNERCIIRAIRPGRTNNTIVLYLLSPIKYNHLATSAYQVEVGLLSHPIKIQGSVYDSEPTNIRSKQTNTSICLDPYYTKRMSIYYNTTQLCMGDTYTNGFGGHIRIEYGTKLVQIQGVELVRMGQTNIMGKYPIHFHLLDKTCTGCYFKQSSIHRSYYRCVAIHGTHNILVTDNVAYDIIGNCYYLEDGVEQNNTISYNLAAHIHTIGPVIPRSDGHRFTESTYFVENDNLLQPADVTASGFYISNINNNVIGNSASGGYAGFAFPILPTGIRSYSTNGYSPALAVQLYNNKIDGNTAHSTGWWWNFGSGFYFGGELYHDPSNNDKLTYNPGRGKQFWRNPCNPSIQTQLKCSPGVTYCGFCRVKYQESIRITNSKTFLIAGVGFNSWTGRIELNGFESHDNRLAINAISDGFWLNNSLITCRTGNVLDLPGNQSMTKLEGTGIVWYDTGQSHILSNIIFRNCGIRSEQYNQYDTSTTRGCSTIDDKSGCSIDSSTFSFLTNSDQFVPEIMQASKQILFDNCGRRFRFTSSVSSSSSTGTTGTSTTLVDTASGRNQNWYDTDGTVSGLNVPTLITSGVPSTIDWFMVDDDVVTDTQGPLQFVPQTSGPNRNYGSFTIEWDKNIQSKVGTSICHVGGEQPCPYYGFIRHAGSKFNPFITLSSSTLRKEVSYGVPITGRGKVVGLTGGYGWILNFNMSSPKEIKITNAQIHPDSILLVSIPYPIGTTFTITAEIGVYCATKNNYTCSEKFIPVSSIKDVRQSSLGNTYYVDNTGVLTIRIGQTATSYTGHPQFILPNYNELPRFDEDVWSMMRYERTGIRIPQIHDKNYYSIIANCPTGTYGNNVYCSGTVNTQYDRIVCPTMYKQVSYDRCCHTVQTNQCIFA